jgi:hypothetical protein
VPIIAVGQLVDDDRGGRGLSTASSAGLSPSPAPPSPSDDDDLSTCLGSSQCYTPMPPHALGHTEAQVPRIRHDRGHRRAGQDAVDVSDHQHGGAPLCVWGAAGRPQLVRHEPVLPHTQRAGGRSEVDLGRRAPCAGALGTTRTTGSQSIAASTSVRQRPPTSASVRNESIAFHDSAISAQPGSCLRSKTVQLQGKELMTAPPRGRGSTSLPGSSRSGNLGSRTPVRKPTASRAPCQTVSERSSR